jgi:hypothetical protein
MRVLRSIRDRREEPAERKGIAGALHPGVRVRLDRRRRDLDPSAWLRKAAQR